jgi:ubiquinone/menaquinone biosynthesis C-methylase UbiE
MKQFNESVLQSLIKPGTRRILNSLTRPDSTVLEVGCGPGQYRLAAKGMYIGVDITTEDYREGVPRIIDTMADARALPFHEQSFDLIFFSNIFHYFENGVKILFDCRRMIRQDGHILIIDYSLPSLKYLQETYKITSPGFNAQLYSSQDWLDMLRSAGYNNPTVRINSPSISSRILKSILLGRLFNNYLDNRNLSIAIIGDK